MKWQDVLAIADRLDADARAEFLAAVERLRSQIDIDRLADLIATGHLTIAEVENDLKGFETDLQTVVAVAQKAFLEAGAASAIDLGLKVHAPSLRFDVANPFAVDAAQTLSAELVTQITGETRLALRALIGQSFTDGLTTRQVARLIRPLIGLTSSSTRAVLNYRSAMIELGHAQDAATHLARKYAVRKLTERSVDIARTELMKASNSGQRTLWRQAAARGLLARTVRRRWIATEDARMCGRCADLDGTTVALNQSFPEGDAPLHTRCRCTESLEFGV